VKRLLASKFVQPGGNEPRFAAEGAPRDGAETAGGKAAVGGDAPPRPPATGASSAPTAAAAPPRKTRMPLIAAAAAIVLIIVLGGSLFAFKDKMFPSPQDVAASALVNGDKYRDGKGVAQDYGQAMTWYRRRPTSATPSARTRSATSTPTDRASAKTRSRR